MIDLPEGHQHFEGRVCTACNEFKPADQYTRERDERAFGGVAMRSKCKPCCEEIKYKSFIKRRYGISYEQYEELLAEQDHKCAICKSKGPNNKRARVKFFVDHCHSTGKVRGLLCSKCNQAIGLMNDDISLLSSAIDYLKTDRA